MGRSRKGMDCKSTWVADQTTHTKQSHSRDFSAVEKGGLAEKCT